MRIELEETGFVQRSKINLSSVAVSRSIPFKIRTPSRHRRSLGVDMLRKLLSKSGRRLLRVRRRDNYPFRRLTVALSRTHAHMHAHVSGASVDLISSARRFASLTNLATGLFLASFDPNLNLISLIPGDYPPAHPPPPFCQHSTRNFFVHVHYENRESSLELILQ